MVKKGDTITKSKDKENKTKPVRFSGSYNIIKFNETKDIETKEINGVTYDVVPLVAVMGDIFLQSVFMPKDVSKSVAESFTATVHDLSHKATSATRFNNGDGFQEGEDVSHVVGFHDDAHYDESVDGIVMNAYISHNAPDYQAWRNYIDICRASGKTPNTSIFGYAAYGMMKASDLPKGVKVPLGAMDRRGNIVYVKKFVPGAVTTCLRGKCSDKDGCGIGVNNSCDSGNCDLDQSIEDNKGNSEDSEQDIEYRNYLINRLKTMKKEKVK